MKRHTLFFLIIACLGIICDSTIVKPRQNVRKFPDGFKFGAATAAYQVEGAWDVDGRTESIWDYVAHKVPSEIMDGSNGDIANDSYNKIERDVEMIRELGLDRYRFSLSWTRILPTGFPDKINEAGVQYYNKLINELLKYNIEPLVTIYHWDMPQKLQEMGGWTSPFIVDWYSDFARIAFTLFGDRVKHWITINEPREICYMGYAAGQFAPRYTIPGVADYLCGKHVLLGHAKAYHIYDEEFRPSQKGTIFIAISASWYEPETTSDELAAEETSWFEWGQYAHPIYSKTGDYPQIMKDRIAAKSAAQGFFRSRLPEFTPEEVEYIKGTSDLFALNHYSSHMVYRNESVIGYHPSPSYYDDIEVITYQKDEWITSLAGAATMTKTTPWGFYKLLTAIRERYDNPTVYICENGYATQAGLNDTERISHYRQYLGAVLDAVDEGSTIIGYTAWSLMDNFEWQRGYTQRFGLYEVDYEDPDRTRTPRKSAFVYKQMIRTRELDLDYEPETYIMTIDEGH